ncbi:hypothetical protein EA659_10605 [Pseudoxanthomonas winnipegensis]|uniref:hypothetical protein n=1 Tax=Pseudoxanthomonas winnipegensis TaxID=2480810 RepID=UPI00102D992F|nr:hypothetical protein [Pseudoxanthomonas winnipegensis]TAA09994.1 hypothetical protein EA659_10605 [Pseudoxanthomonas winnipegensis]TAH73039.1 hypothetical protein EA657_04845 [Pseudoxanthomonas winnipegensis]
MASLLLLTACDGKPEAGNQPAPQTMAAPSPPGVVAEPKDDATAIEASIQRAYPTAGEEKALDLNYPLVKDYGPDAARLTPLFPGTSERPLSVVLKASTGGYSLKAEGEGCKFAVAYELKQPDGTVVVHGENRAPETSVLPGWADGSRVLIVKMADGADNNYSCNLVVSRH